MTELHFEPNDVEPMMRALVGVPSGARVVLAAGRFKLPFPIVLSTGVELVGDPGRTILDGGGKHTIFMLNGIDQVFSLDGLILEGGRGQWGGAIFSGSRNRLRIDRCRFTRNRAHGDGGALFVRNAVESRITRTIFEKNAAKRGGGAFDIGHGADVLVDRCIFRANKATIGGAALLSGSGALELRNCTLVDNRASWKRGGGALFVDGARSSGPSAYVANSIFSGHEAIASDPSKQYQVFFVHSIVPADLFEQPRLENVKGNTVGTPRLERVGEFGWRLAPGAPGAGTANVDRIERAATDIFGQELVRDGVADPGALARL